MSIHKAGDQFLCVCCREVSPSPGTYDDQLAGPVCNPCQSRLVYALKAMREFMGVKRPMTVNDITPENKNRIKDFYST